MNVNFKKVISRIIEDIGSAIDLLDVPYTDAQNKKTVGEEDILCVAEALTEITNTIEPLLNFKKINFIDDNSVKPTEIKKQF